MRPSSITALLLVLAAAFALSFFKTTDQDVFWHLKAGQVMVSEGRLLEVNTFSSAHADHPWSNPNWLFQVVLAGVHRLGGWCGVTLFKTALSALLGLCLFVILMGEKRRPLPAAALVVFVLAAIQFRLIARPHLASYLFFALTVLVVRRWRRGSRREIWLLPPLFLLWGNVHAELAAGLLYLGGTAFGELLARRRGHPALGNLRHLIAATALSIAATLVNPEGYGVLLYPLVHLGQGTVIRITEFASSFSMPVPLFWVLLAASLFSLPRRPFSRTDLQDGAVVVIFGTLAVLYVRVIPYFAIACAPILYSRLVSMVGDRKETVSPRLVFALWLAAAGSLTWAFGFDRLLPYRWGCGPEERLLPAAAAEFVAREDLPSNLFNEFADGGYLIFRLAPQFGVFQDGRVPAYPREFLSRIHRREDAARWQETLEEYGVKTALVRQVNITRYGFSRDRWGIVFWDDYRAVLVRRGGHRDELLRRLEYRLFTPGADLDSYRKGDALRSLMGEMERNQVERLEASPLLLRDLEEIRSRLRGLQGP